MAWKFIVPDNSLAQRDDGATVPWNPARNEPADEGYVRQLWIAAGRPMPDAYVAPAPTAEEQRTASFLSDVDRQSLVQALAGATPAQIKTFVANNVTDLASARVMLQKILLLVAMQIRS